MFSVLRNNNTGFTCRSQVMTRRVPYSLGIFQIRQLAAIVVPQYVADANVPVYPPQFYKEFQRCVAGMLRITAVNNQT